MLCPICYKECTQKFTLKKVSLGVSCEIITGESHFHRFIYFSDVDFMASFYSAPFDYDKCIVIGAHPTLKDPNYVFARNNTTIKIPEFSPCEMLIVLDRCLNMSCFI